jgi:pimeloyl-ACP methyl ester carboxylesterase
MATGGSIIAGAVPSQLLRLGALSVCRGWRHLQGTAWSWSEEIARHDWSKIIQAGREICRFDSRSWVTGTSVPTTVIATSDDAVVPYRRQLALVDAIPGATLRTVDGGHAACTTASDSFVPALVDACLEIAQRATRAGLPRRVGDAA